LSLSKKIKKLFVISQLIFYQDKTFIQNFTKTGQSKNTCLDVFLKLHPSTHEGDAKLCIPL